MTNSERDTLLINLTTSVNNINNTLNDFRTEMRHTENTLKSEIKQTEATLSAKINQVAENAHAELKQTEATLSTKIDQVAENASVELKTKIDQEAKGAHEIIQDTWARQRKAEQRLDSHDVEIRELKIKLA